MAGADDGEVITRGKIFISYRRSDDPGFALLVYERLEQEFGGANLFMDVEGKIRPGDDFVKELNDQVAKCDVLLAIIGEGWIGARDADGNLRLESESDFVRIEIASALTHGKRVIPVLVNKAEMPRADELPEPLKALTRRNAVAIRPTRSKADCQGLISALKDVLGKAEAEPAVETEAKLDPNAGTSVIAEEIRKAEELANWEHIKDGARPAEFRDHLARFEGGPTERFARKKLEGLLWANPATRASIEALRKFLEEFPKGDCAAQAHANLAILEREADQARRAEEHRRAETEAWAKVAASTDIADLEAFLKAWPGGAHTIDADARIKELRDSLTRRRILKGVGIAAAATALSYSTFRPGEWVWRQLHDQSVRTFTGHAGSVSSIAFSSDGRTALSGSSDKTLKLWDIDSGQEIRTFAGHAGWVDTVALSPDGYTALSGSSDQTLRLWNLTEGKEVRTFGYVERDLFGRGVISVAFAPEGLAALAAHRSTLKLWDLVTGKEIWAFSPVDHLDCIAFSRDGRTAFCGSQFFNQPLKLWDLAARKEIQSFATHPGIAAVALSPDGRAALSGGHDELKLWDLATGKGIHTFTEHTDSVFSVAFSPDGRNALSGSRDTTLKLWDLTTGEKTHTFTGHTDWVASVAVSPDGRTALAGSGDKTLKLWDLSPYLPAAS